MVDPPKSAKVIGCKWVHNIKHDMTFKSRLGSTSFKQTHGIDYNETFSPVVMLKSIRILLAIAAYYVISTQIMLFWALVIAGFKNFLCTNQLK